MPVIQTKDLCKNYRRFEKEAGLLGSFKSLFARKTIEKAALSGFDLSLEAGEFVGLIGPNGAGKTTLVKCLTGIIAPTSGEIDVLGFYPNRLENAFKRQYAVVMGQKTQLWPELTTADNLLLFQRLYDVSDQDYRARVGMLTELFAIKDLLNVQVRTLSLGERMKMELTAALLHRPKILFLDEPTIGLDAVAQKQIRGFLHSVNREMGATILLTSHYMEDIRALCPRSVLIGGGRKLYDGGTQELFERQQTKRRLTIEFACETQFHASAPCVFLEQSPFRVSMLVARVDAKAVLQSALEHFDVTDVAVEEEDIGSVVERIYKEAAL